ncbi:MFS transporter [Shimwellia pseudoproteus]|uniref:MFS transporter n=1 Tax=Shimwellia pseudoproteus TaxID=570012 RepID=UPI0018EC1DB4|nr:MFS transporter [Shimwellia pseudoproteus]MBJ3813683.1 MFS transporter [Shimwellia pseudoproteus]
MLKLFPRAIPVLLICSLFLTIGRGITLPFMTIYLTRHYNLSVHQVGIAMTVALVIGVVFSLLFGVVADKFDKKRYMLLSVAAFLLGFILIPLSQRVDLVVVWFSVINCAYGVFSTVLKSYFSDTLAVYQRPKIFSLNYTFVNIGWTLGPPLGTLLVMHSLNLPFWVSAMTAIGPLLMISRWVAPTRPVTTASRAAPFRLGSLLRDRPLRWFTASMFLGQIAFGAFTACLSQYAITFYDVQFASQIIAVVLPVNAAVVVLLQYPVGKILRNDNLRRFMGLGTLFFIVGLAGFMVSGTRLWLWGVAAIIFTLGELIYIPGEYMLLDNIAPPGMKASYFSAQNLGMLGSALNPLLTGYLLTWLPGYGLFLTLMILVMLAWVCMLQGSRQPPGLAA